VKRHTNPDRLLQRTVDLANAEVLRLESKHASADALPCPTCGGGGELTKEERSFLRDILRELRLVTFGARKILNDSHLRKLGEQGLEQFSQALEAEKTGGVFDGE